MLPNTVESAGSIVIGVNPFIQKCEWAELPFTPIGKNWITDEYGIDINESANKYVNWLYMEIPNFGVLQFTPEAMQDKPEMKAVLNNLIPIQ